MRDALDVILTGHEPYPAVAVDRVWNMVAANTAMFPADRTTAERLHEPGSGPSRR